MHITVNTPFLSCSMFAFSSCILLYVRQQIHSAASKGTVQRLSIHFVFSLCLYMCVHNHGICHRKRFLSCLLLCVWMCVFLSLSSCSLFPFLPRVRARALFLLPCIEMWQGHHSGPTCHYYKVSLILPDKGFQEKAKAQKGQNKEEDREDAKMWKKIMVCVCVCVCVCLCVCIYIHIYIYIYIYICT